MTKGRRSSAILVAGLAGALSWAPADAQSLRGVLSDRVTYEPIDLGTVTLIDTTLDTLAQVVTDERGYFSFDLTSSGEYYLIASALGYQAMRSDAVRVGAGEARIVELSMSTRPVPVEGLLVEARADEPQIAELRGTGFYERLARGRGEFLTPGQIAESAAKWPQQLFWGMRSVRVHQQSHQHPGPWNDDLVIPNRQDRGYCSPSIYVDGIWMRRENLAPGASLADIVHRDDVLAVEVYEWPFGVPHPYVGTQSCGVILFWTDQSEG